MKPYSPLTEEKMLESWNNIVVLTFIDDGKDVDEVHVEIIAVAFEELKAFFGGAPVPNFLRNGRGSFSSGTGKTASREMSFSRVCTENVLQPIYEGMKTRMSPKHH